MATSSVVVHLADLPAVQGLVVAAAQIMDGVGTEWIRQPGVRTHALIPIADLVTLLEALEALEAAK